MNDAHEPTYDPTELTSETRELLKEPQELERLFDAKQQLIEMVDANIGLIVETPRTGARRNRFSAWITTYELLLAQIIRDDSPISTKGTDGIQQTIDEVCKGASLREDLPISPPEAEYPPFIKGVQNLKAAQDNYRRYISGLTPQDPNPIIIWSGASPRFDKYGKILEIPDQAVIDFFRKKSLLLFYVDGHKTGLRIGEDGVWEAGRLVMNGRPLEIYMQDYHEKTEEVLVPDKPTILQVESPTAEQRGYFNGELFYVPRGVVVYLKRNVRHFAPLPLLPGATTSPVIFRLATTTDEKDFHHQQFKYARRIL